MRQVLRFHPTPTHLQRCHAHMPTSVPSPVPPSLHRPCPHPECGAWCAERARSVCPCHTLTACQPACLWEQMERAVQCLNAPIGCILHRFTFLPLESSFVCMCGLAVWRGTSACGTLCLCQWLTSTQLTADSCSPSLNLPPFPPNLPALQTPTMPCLPLPDCAA